MGMSDRLVERDRGGGWAGGGTRRCGRPGGANRDDPAGNPEADLPADAAGSAPDFRPLVLTGL